MTSYVPTSFAESNFDEESLIARQKQKLGTLVSPSELFFECEKIKKSGGATPYHIISR
jgi:hypothetical protein